MASGERRLRNSQSIGEYQPAASRESGAEQRLQRGFVFLTLWRTLFLCCMAFAGVAILQGLWVYLFGGFRGLQGWVIKVANSPDDGFAIAWAKFVLVLACLAGMTALSWRQQNRISARARSRV